MKKSLSRRLERLEERMIPIGEPMTIDVVFIKPDGTEAPGGFSIEIPSHGPVRSPRGIEHAQRIFNGRHTEES